MPCGGVKGGVKSTWNQGLNVVVDTNGLAESLYRAANDAASVGVCYPFKNNFLLLSGLNYLITNRQVLLLLVQEDRLRLVAAHLR